MPYEPVEHPRRIVVTGGPGGGKTTAADLFRRELGDKVVIVPESATLLFSGGFPRVSEPHGKRAVQKTIFSVQRNLEDLQSCRFQDRILLCDRGTVDGCVYWPESPESFFATMGTTLADELGRYAAVIYFESAAVGGLDIENGNPTRIESLAEATALDRKLREIWSKHPRLEFVPHHVSFMKKITLGLKAIQRAVNELSGVTL